MNNNNPVTPSSGGSYIVAFWARVFGLLSRIALFPWVMKGWQLLVARRVPDETRRRHLTFLLVDTWTLGHLVLALVSLMLVNSDQEWCRLVGYAFAAYGVLRTFELVVYQVNVLLFDEYRATKNGTPYQIRGYRRMVILLIHNYFEVIAWFACAHHLLAQLDQVSLTNHGVLAGLREALTLMVAFSANGVGAISTMGHAMLLFQAAIGILMTLVMLARFISILPIPKTMDEHELHDR